MFKKGDIIEIEIDSLAYGGEGVGKSNGIAVFVEDGVPGDRLKVQIISAKKGYAKGKILEIISPSTHRIKPFCALTNVCGGCQWQHIDYNYQLTAKRQIVEDSLKKIGGIEIEVKNVIPSPQIQNYRCKVQYPVGQTKVSKRFLVGYYRKGTHEIVNIKYCMAHPEIINDITEFTRIKLQEYNLTAYDEKKHKGLIRHIVFRYSDSEKKLLLIFVINDKEITSELRTVCKTVFEQFSQIAGVLVNFNTAKTNVIIGNQTERVCGDDYILEILDGRKFKISAGSFFQVNPGSAVNIFNNVQKMIEEKLKLPKILDVYAGVGSFAVWLKDIASEITAIEQYPQAVADAKENIRLNHAQNIKILEGDAQVVLNELSEAGEKFDVVILDPPRKGCTVESLDSAVNLSDKYIIYVSCNPTTLARDLKILKEKGFTPEFAQPVDMFCHTYHVESIVVLSKI